MYAAGAQLCPCFFLTAKLIYMKTAGIILIVAGLLITILSGATFVTKKKVVDIGKLEVTKDEEHQLPWAPYAGLGVLAIGGVLLVAGARKA